MKVRVGNKLPAVGATIEITDGPLEGLTATVTRHCCVNGEKVPSAVMFDIDYAMFQRLTRSAGGLPRHMKELKPGMWFAMDTSMVRQVLQ